MGRQYFPLQLVGTPQVLTFIGAPGEFHQLTLAFQTAPSAGVVLIEYKPLGAMGFTALAHATAASLTSGRLSVRVDGPVEAFRVTFSSLTGGASPALWVDSQVVPEGLYGGLAAMTTQPYTEANVKNGLQFYARAVWPLADPIATGTTRKLWFKTNAKPVIVKLRELQFVAEELKLQLFAGPTGVSGGTDVTIHNYNAVAPVATTVQAKKNVTITDNGTEFDGGDPEHFFGGATQPQRNVAVALIGRERIIPANSEFAVVITNTGTGDARAQYLLDFYEGATDLPL